MVVEWSGSKDGSLFVTQLVDRLVRWLGGGPAGRAGARGRRNRPHSAGAMGGRERHLRGTSAAVSRAECHCRSCRKREPQAACCVPSPLPPPAGAGGHRGRPRLPQGRRGAGPDVRPAAAPQPRPHLGEPASLPRSCRVLVCSAALKRGLCGHEGGHCLCFSATPCGASPHPARLPALQWARHQHMGPALVGMMQGALPHLDAFKVCGGVGVGRAGATLECGVWAWVVGPGKPLLREPTLFVPSHTSRLPSLRPGWCLRPFGPDNLAIVAEHCPPLTPPPHTHPAPPAPAPQMGYQLAINAHYICQARSGSRTLELMTQLKVGACGGGGGGGIGGGGWWWVSGGCGGV